MSGIVTKKGLYAKDVIRAISEKPEETAEAMGLGSAATQPVEAFATGAEGDLAATALQPSSDLGREDDLVNTQMFSFKKVNSWTSGGGGQAPPLRVAVVGDSFASYLGLGPRMGSNGVIGLAAINSSGTVTTTNTRFDLWMTGRVTQISTGASAEWVKGGVTDVGGYIIADKACVAYTKVAGGGSFDLQYQPYGSTTWTTLGTVATANASTVGAYVTYDLPTSTFPRYKLRINNVTGGTINIVAVGMYNSNGGGAILITSDVTAKGGLDLVDTITTPSAVINPIWAGFAPDVVLSRWADAYTEWQTGGRWRTLYATLKAAYNPTDYIQIGPHYMNSSVTSQAVSDVDSAQRAWARETSETFVSCSGLLRSWDDQYALGISTDDEYGRVHLTFQGQNIINQYIWRKTKLGNVYLGQEIYGAGSSPLFSTVLGSGNVDAMPMSIPRQIIGSASGYMMPSLNLPYDYYNQAGLQNSNGELALVTGGGAQVLIGRSSEAGAHPVADGRMLGRTNFRWRIWASGAQFGIVTKTADYTATADDHTILCNTSGGAWKLSLPAASSHSGRVYVIKKIDSSGNKVTIDPNGSETLDGAPTVEITTQWQTYQIQSDGSNWYKIN